MLDLPLGLGVLFRGVLTLNKKKAVSITIDADLLEWIESQIETKRFASVSHGIEFCVQQEKEREKKD